MPPETELSRHPENEIHRSVYEENAAVIYETLRWFLAEGEARDAIQIIAAELQDTIEASGYTRYAKLVTLRLVYEYVLKTKEANCEAFVGLGKSESMTKEEAIPLLLHDKLDLPVDQVASILGISVGSVRTRLEKTRTRIYRNQDLPPALKSDSKEHTCIRSKDWIEELRIAKILELGTSRANIPTDITKCARCTLHLEQRLNSIHELERRTHLLPEEFKSFPETHLILRDKGRTKFNWAAAPWYVKALLEGALATSLVLGIVLAVPRVKSLYELWLERRIDLYSLAELSTSLSTLDSETEATLPQTQAATDTNVTETTQNTPEIPAEPGKKTGDSGERLTIKPETEFGGREAESASPNKVYRVLIKSDAPEALRDSVMAVLGKYEHLTADPQVPPGTEIPGGIMFDIFVPLKSYKAIVNDLVPLGEMKVIITQSKERGMAGKARIKIWLQRI